MKTIVLVASMLFCAHAGAQQLSVSSISSEPLSADSLPDAPLELLAQNGSPTKDVPPPPSTVPQGIQGPFGPLPPLLTTAPLTPHQKLIIYVHETYGPPAVVFPAISAGIRMIRPPANYPHEWKDGAGAYGRLYGDVVARQTAERTTKFITEIAVHEDPRYLPAAPGSNVPGRIFHAVAFTFVDRNTSGHWQLAFSNYTSALAGGFVGNAYLPDGHNDVTHAGQRSATQFLGIGIANIAKEFAPELAPIVRKIHLPQILPPWWVPDRSPHPMGQMGHP